MSRILLLLLFVLWMAWTSAPSQSPTAAERAVPELLPGVVTFVSFYALMVLVLGLWSRLLAARVAADNFRRSLRRYNATLLAARLGVPAWFGFGVFSLGWGWVVIDLLDNVYRPLGVPLAAARRFELPALLIALLPPLAAWVGLWWAQYPAERALREQNLLPQLEADLPVQAPPSFRQYFMSNLRLQVLFTVVPVLLIVFMRDVLSFAFALTGGSPEWAEYVTMFGAAGVVFLFAPEVLRRVLHTEPLADSPLRRRLEALCRRTGMRYRDILVWKTHNNMGNAAVMGIVPQMRYILLSDLLLETMSEEQVEAVFAHEVGHVVHKHMAWFVVFFLIVVLGGWAADRWAVATMAGPVAATAAGDNPVLIETVVQGPAPTVEDLRPVPRDAAEVFEVPAWLSAVGSMAGFLIAFGFLSRRFERQADVFAARTMESSRNAAAAAALHADGGATGPIDATGPAAASSLSFPPPPYPAVTASPRYSHVGPYGATLFTSALERVAVVNNIPLGPRGRWRGGPARRLAFLAEYLGEAGRNWFHGSILQRMRYLQRISVDPDQTVRFDRFMVRLYCLLLVLLFLCAAVVAAVHLLPAPAPGGAATIQ